MTQPTLRPITFEDPWRWLVSGWRDMTQIPGISLSYGLIFFLEFALVVGLIIFYQMSALALPIAAGLMLLGPALAAGLYEASRRLEAGEAVRLQNVFVLRSKAPGQIALFGVALVLIFLVWIRIAMLLFALFFGQLDIPPLETFLSDLLLTNEGLSMLVLGTAIGGAIAFVIFMMSAISVPMLFDRDIDVMSAIVTSMSAVMQNLAPMLLWGWLIVVIFTLGLAAGGIGLAIAFPLVGHATWHAYRAMTE